MMLFKNDYFRFVASGCCLFVLAKFYDVFVNFLPYHYKLVLCSRVMLVGQDWKDWMGYLVLQARLGTRAR